MTRTDATTMGRPGLLWPLAITVLMITASLLWTPRASSQEGGPAEPLTAAELEALVGPIALYPDDVLAVLLPASTYPLQIVQAARFLDDREANPSLQPDPGWDDSVVALLNYPDVVRLLNDDLDWTWDLGEAVLDDQAAVLAAIQTFRDRAYDAGNLLSDDRQVVTETEGVIAIAPANPEVVYIPYYEPASVVVYQPRPVFHYYPYAYPLYYYPYPIGYRFSSGFFWGVTSAFLIGWDTHYIHVHHHTHYRHPYYRRPFYTPYYARRGINVTVNVNNYRNVWQPRRERGARPYDGIRAIRGDDRAQRTYDGRRYRYNEGTTGRNQQRIAAPTGSTERRSATLPRQGNGAPRNQVPGTAPRQRSAAPGTSREQTSRPGTFAGVAPENRTRAPQPGTSTRQPAGRTTPDRSRPDGVRPYRVPGNGTINRGTAPNRALPERSGSENRSAVGRPAPQRITPTAPPARVRAMAQPQTPPAIAPQARAPQTRSVQPRAPQAAAPQARAPQARAPQTRPQGGSSSRFGGVAPAARSARAAPAGGQTRSASGAGGQRMQQSAGARQSRR